MKCNFFTVLRGLKVNENLGGGDKFGLIFRITNDRKTIEKLLSSEIKQQIGILETNALLSGDLVVMCSLDMPDDMTPLEYLDLRIAQLQSFQFAMWLAKDHSVNTEMSYLTYQLPDSWGITSNFRAVQYRNAHGKAEVVQLTREHLKGIRNLWLTAFSPQVDITRRNTQMRTDSTREERAIFFIDLARSESDLAIKITLYCSAFETLLSTSQTELAHQLSERISFFLARNKSERHQIYKDVKDAYNVRSKIVHGATLSAQKISQLPEISCRCDSHIRQLMILILTNSALNEIFKQPNGKFDETLIKMIMSNMCLAEVEGLGDLYKEIIED
jgi:hypothetical protein